MAFPWKIIVCVVIVVLAIIIGLLAGSVSVLQPTEVGFVFNANTRSIDLSKLYGPGGRYFIGLGQRFVVYPTHILIYHYGDEPDADSPSLECFTQDGQTVTISCTIMLQLQTEHLSELYHLYGENQYATNFIRIAQTIIHNSASQFIANDYFLNRTGIRDTYFIAIKEQLNTIFADLKYFQLLHIVLPPQLETVISNKIVTNQTAKTTQAQQSATLIRSQTSVDVAQGDYLINQRTTAANINYTNTLLQAQAQSQQIILTAEAKALQQAKTILSLSDNSTSVLLNWLWQRYITQLQGTDLWVGWNAVSQIVTP